MQPAAQQLTELLQTNLPLLRKINELESLSNLGTATWSRREILGHLIDSAVNNHQRFVRAQIDDALAFPGYEQDRWVSLQGYRDRSWSELVDVWTELNVHLAHTIERIPESRLDTPCTIGGASTVTLEFMVLDYLHHLKHHIEQILKPADSLGKKHPPFA